jgi:hypothetical protein
MNRTSDKLSPPRKFERFAALSVLATLGLSWPVLELVGNNAEFFLARHSSRWETATTALAIGLVLPIVIGLLGLLPGRAGTTITAVIIGMLATVVGFLFIRRLPFDQTVSQVVALGVGAVAPLSFVRYEGMRMLFRYLSPAPLLVPLLFIFATPAGGTVLGEESQGLQIKPANPVNVVMVMLDEFPLASLIDPNGNLRSDRYPNFARLAADGTWFRNAVTVEQQTEHSVPAMLTGAIPDQALEPFAGQYPNSLFTALAGSYRMEVDETITRLCPLTVCAPAPSTESVADRSGSMLQDLGIVASHALLPGWLSADLPQIDRSWGDFGAASAEFDGPQAFLAEAKNDPRAKFERLVEAILAGGRDAAPTLYFTHALIPHYPWVFLPDGRRYPLNAEWVPGTIGPGWDEDTWLIAQGLQRHLLQVQYTDRAIGQIIDAMVSAGIYDDSLLIVVADHGISFVPGIEHWRRIRPETVGDIAAIPLFIKAPGRPGGVIDDRRALTIDLLPTIADVVGFDPPWQVEGASLFGPSPRRAETTTVGPTTSATFGVDGTEKLAMAGRNAKWFPTYDPWELVPEGARDLRGRYVDFIAGRATSLTTRLDRAFWYNNVDVAGDLIPVRISGKLFGADSPVLLGVSVNGVVGAMTRSYSLEDETFFQALVPPEYFRQGKNTIELIAIDGDEISVVPLV